MNNMKLENDLPNWRNEAVYISDKLKYVFKNKLWTDCKILVGSNDLQAILKEFSAHKLILSLSSAKLALNFAEIDIEEPIRICDVSPAIFEKLLSFMYTDSINIKSMEFAFEVCNAAGTLGMEQLMQLCLEYILENLDCSNVVNVYQFAKSNDFGIISEKAMHILRERTAEVMSSTEFVCANLDTVMDILNENELNVSSELELFTYFQNWIELKFSETYGDEINNDVKLRELVKPALKKIRFLAMGVAEFTKATQNSRLLSKADISNLALNIISPELQFPLPDDFDKNREPRVYLAMRELSVNAEVYMQRPIKNPIIRENTDKLTDTIHFIVNKDIKLFGIQVPAQVYSSVKDTNYTESLLVSICKLQNLKRNWIIEDKILTLKTKKSQSPTHNIDTTNTDEVNTSFGTPLNRNVNGNNGKSSEQNQQSSKGDKIHPVQVNELSDVFVKANGLFTFGAAIITPPVSESLNDSDTSKRGFNLPRISKEISQNDSIKDIPGSEIVTPKSSGIGFNFSHRSRRQIKSVKKAHETENGGTIKRSLDLFTPEENTKCDKVEKFSITTPEETTEHFDSKIMIFNPTVGFHSVIDVKFKTPIEIPKCCPYKLEVTLRKAGHYAVGYFDKSANVYANNVQFQLKGYSNRAFVTSLLFAI